MPTITCAKTGIVFESDRRLAAKPTLESLCEQCKAEGWTLETLIAEFDRATSKSDSEYIYKSTVKQRGWTDGAIKEWLGEPDKTVKNPNYKSGPPSSLYLLSRVVAVEESQEFKDWLAKHSTRREALSMSAKTVAQSRRASLLADIESRFTEQVKATLSGYSDYRVLVREALSHRCAVATERAIRKGDFEYIPALPDLETTDSETVQRWVANYVRHGLSTYEDEFIAAKGCPGAGEIRDLMHDIVYHCLAERFPTTKSPQPAINPR